MSDFPRFEGNCPRNVSKDASYVVRSKGGEHVVALTYVAEEDEKWYATCRDHPALVEMVNNVKLELTGSPGGTFYINEYRQVIVPVVGTEDYFLAEKYEPPLRFDFEGTILTGEPVDLEQSPLSPGDTWVGPHPGIPYKLAAGGNDVAYTIRPRPSVEQTIKLSKVIGEAPAREVASMIQAVKGPEGGRFYVNEFRSIFAPVRDADEWRHIFIGTLDLDNWFPEPHASSAD